MDFLCIFGSQFPIHTVKVLSQVARHPLPHPSDVMQPPKLRFVGDKKRHIPAAGFRWKLPKTGG